MVVPAATQDGIAKLLDELGLAAVREQALATSEDMGLVVVSKREISHFYALDGRDGRFGRSRTLIVSSLQR